MGKKYIQELITEELTKVFHANGKLAEEVYESMVDSEMYWVSEKLEYVKTSLSNWSFGPYNRNYVNISNHDAFILGMEEMDKSVPALIDTDRPVLEQALEARENYRDAELYSDEYYEFEEAMEEAGDALADLLVIRLTQDIDGCSKTEYQLDYFISFYVEAQMSEEAYIIEEANDFILHEDISYTKSYN